MPLDSMLLSIAIIFVFTLFAVVLGWTDYSTTKWQKTQQNRTSSDSFKKAA